MPLAASRGDVTAQADVSVIFLPLASVQAPDEQTETSVTGLPVASRQVELELELELELDEWTDEEASAGADMPLPCPAMAWPISTKATAATAADWKKNPCFMMCLWFRVRPQDQK